MVNTPLRERTRTPAPAYSAIRANRTRTVLALHCREFLARQRERRVPADGFERAVGALAQRLRDAIRIGFQIEDRIALRAHMATRERIVLVFADGDQSIALLLEFQAAAVSQSGHAR